TRVGNAAAVAAVIVVHRTYVWYAASSTSPTLRSPVAPLGVGRVHSGIAAAGSAVNLRAGRRARRAERSTRGHGVRVVGAAGRVRPAPRLGGRRAALLHRLVGLALRPEPCHRPR